MDGIEQLVKKLKDRIERQGDKIKTIAEAIKNFKKQSSIDQETISSKEKELEQVNTKLIACQTERDNVSEEIGKKISELNHSNLSKEEKAGEISKLMTGEYQKLKSSCSKLTQTLKEWGEAKNNLNELERTLSTSRLEGIHSLEKTKKNQQITIWVLLGVIILLSLSLSLFVCVCYCFIQKKQ